MMVAARAMVERKTFGQPSYRVGTNHQFLSRPTMISMPFEACNGLVVFHRRHALLPPGDAATYPFVFQRVPKSVSVIAANSEQPVAHWETAEQGPRRCSRWLNRRRRTD